MAQDQHGRRCALARGQDGGPHAGHARYGSRGPVTAAISRIDPRERSAGRTPFARFRAMVCFVSCMPAALPNSVRILIVAAREAESLSYEELSRRYGTSRATVNRLLRRHRESGRVEPSPHGGGQPKLMSEKDRRCLAELLRGRPDATRDELRVALRKQVGVEVSVATVGRELHALGMTRKKRRSYLRSRPHRGLRLVARRSWPKSASRTPRS